MGGNYAARLDHAPVSGPFIHSIVWVVSSVTKTKKYCVGDNHLTKAELPNLRTVCESGGPGGSQWSQCDAVLGERGKGEVYTEENGERKLRYT